MAAHNPNDVADEPPNPDHDPTEVPRTQCHKDVGERVKPYWEEVIVPDLRAAALTGSAVLIAAHGNSIRALRKHLQGISDDEITGLEIPTGIPYRMRLAPDLSVRSADYLGDPEAAAAAAAAVARQADQPVA
jgi:2,3-bisphosphoglycerate-dependent phosphoglycerate mutase